MPGGKAPVDPETRSRIVDLIKGRELSRNAIAREFGLAGSTITRIAQDEGLEFDRQMSEILIASRRIDIGLMRSELAKASLAEALTALEEMHSPAKLIQFEAGHQLTTHDAEGKESASWEPGSWREHVIDEPTFSDKRNLATIFGIMVTKAKELTSTNDPTSAGEAVSHLDSLADSLRTASAILKASETDPTVEPTGVSREAMLAEFEGDPAQDPSV